MEWQFGSFAQYIFYPFHLGAQKNHLIETVLFLPATYVLVGECSGSVVECLT